MAKKGRQCARHPDNRGVVCEMDPLGKNVPKMEFFVKEIEFFLMPARNQNLQQQGAGGGGVI